jgi:hypothetical protein
MNYRDSLYGRFRHSWSWEGYRFSELYGKNNLDPNLIGVFYFLYLFQNNVMISELKKLIENNEVSEIEIVEFLSTLKKLSNDDVFDRSSFSIMLNHFGLKTKNDWIKFSKTSKYKF